MSKSLNDLPKTNADIVKVALYAKENWKEPDDHSIFVSYLLTHGFGRLRVHNVLKLVWPEAAACIEIDGPDAYRAMMLAYPGKANRKGVIALLEGGRQQRRLSDVDYTDLLDEWDALTFPSQVPHPYRERALRRHRFAIGESDER